MYKTVPYRINGEMILLEDANALPGGLPVRLEIHFDRVSVPTLRALPLAMV
jgi:hypothetical protein